MSANPNLFDAIRPAAYAFTRRLARDTRAPVDPAALSAFLDETVARYRDSGGVSDLTEATVRDVKASIVRFCTERLQAPRGYSVSNVALERHMRPLARERAKAMRRTKRGPVDCVALRVGVETDVAAYRSQPGRAHADDDHAGLTDRLVNWYGRMKPTRSEISKTTATDAARAELDFAVWAVVHGGAVSVEGLSVEAIRAQVETLRRRYALKKGKDGTLSYVPVSVTHGAVRGAVQRLRGQPEREAAICALPPTARDVVHVLETEGLPGKRVSVVMLAALAGKLWTPSANPAALRQHRHRLRQAAAVIERAGIGLHIAVLAEHVVVARQCRLPSDLQAVAAAAVEKRKVRALSRGMMHRRQGPWGTEEGLDAQATCRVIASHSGDEDLARVLHVTGHGEAQDAFLSVSVAYHSQVHRSTEMWIGHVRRRQSGDLAFLSGGGGDPAVAAATGFIEGLLSTARDYDLGQAWSDVAGTDAYRKRLAGAVAAPARHRVMHIASVLCGVQDASAWEAALLADVVGYRPGRRPGSAPVPAPLPSLSMPEHEVVPMPAPAVPAPQPVETFRPTWRPETKLSDDLLEEIQIHHSVNRLKKQVALFRRTYAGLSADADLADLPMPKTAGAALIGIRALRAAMNGADMSVLGLLDRESGDIITNGLRAAETALIDYGDRAVVLSNTVVARIAHNAVRVDRAVTLRRDLLALAEEFAWIMHRYRSVPGASLPSTCV